MTKINMIVLSILLSLILSGCLKYNASKLDIREDYIVCFSSEDKNNNFRQFLISLARQENMAVLDRGAEAEQELKGLEHGAAVLDSTSGPLILMTIEHKDALRISITNAGLGDDMSLTFLYSTEPRPNEATRVLQFANQEGDVMLIDSAGPGALPCENF